MREVDTDFSKFDRIVVDSDWIVYAVSHSGEKKTIKAVLKTTGEEFDLANRTTLWGRKKSKDGGYLEELNKSRNTSYTWEDFEIYDVQTPEELPNVLHSAKMMVEGLRKTTGIKNVELYIGEGQSFRYNKATLTEYKSNRIDTLIPIHKQAVKDYLVKYHGAKVIKGLEVDDVVVMEGYKDSRTLVVSVDKDSRGFPIYLFNPTHPEWGILNCRGLGSLWWDTSGKQKKLMGIGRKWFYGQICRGDPVDAIRPTAVSDMQIGDVGTYEALVNCENDLECFKAIKDIYQRMYPEPKKIKTWDGKVIEIDWVYVLDEMWELLRMKRFDGDDVTASDVFRKYGLLD